MLKVIFAGDCVGEEAKKITASMKPGDVVLLENLRFYEEEEGKPYHLGENPTDEEKKAGKAKVKESQKEFVKTLASYADCYVNDAFGTAHRAHASTALIAAYFPNDSMFGFLIESELKAMDKILLAPEKPFTAIMGGAKVSDKILIIENLLDRVDNLVIGGGMTYTFIKAQGGKIGKSLCEEDKLDLALDILKKAKEKGVNVILPVDAINADAFDANANTQVSKTNETPDGWMGLDIADESIKLISDVIEKSKTVLWNGPMGVFEMEKFAKGTSAVAQAIAKATEKGAFSLIGGGDSVAAINKNKLADKVSYVSTGGGAMLEYMEGKELPGIKAVRAWIIHKP
jgi:phosphoglycerate kinase